jgi:hypothetical protein
LFSSNYDIGKKSKFPKKLFKKWVEKIIPEEKENITCACYLGGHKNI